MFEILVLWAFLLAACLLVGEATTRLAGLARWSWLSGTFGLCVLLVIGAAAPSLPGHAKTAFVLIVALTLAAGGLDRLPGPARAHDSSRGARSTRPSSRCSSSPRR